LERCIGRALLSNPSIVLNDKATEGLAPKVRDDIWSTLRIIVRKGVAVVVVDKNIDDLVVFPDGMLSRPRVKSC